MSGAHYGHPNWKDRILDFSHPLGSLIGNRLGNGPISGISGAGWDDRALECKGEELEQVVNSGGVALTSALFS